MGKGSKAPPPFALSEVEGQGAPGASTSLSTNEFRFALPFTAAAQDIDELGHVNNAVWVAWVQRLSVAHWQAVASAAHQAAHVWVVTRHEIDYRGNVALGETVTGETWVEGQPKGARFDRRFRFIDGEGRVKVEGRSTWALLDRATGRLLRIRPDVAAPFLAKTRGA